MLIVTGLLALWDYFVVRFARTSRNGWVLVLSQSNGMEWMFIAHSAEKVGVGILTWL